MRRVRAGLYCVLIAAGCGGGRDSGGAPAGPAPVSGISMPSARDGGQWRMPPKDHAGTRVSLGNRGGRAPAGLDKLREEVRE